jgi:hypothetical protein
VVLRRLRAADLSAVAHGADDSEIARFTPGMPSPYTLDDAYEFIAEAERRWQETGLDGRPPTRTVVELTAEGPNGARSEIERAQARRLIGHIATASRIGAAAPRARRVANGPHHRSAQWPNPLPLDWMPSPPFPTELMLEHARDIHPASLRRLQCARTMRPPTTRRPVPLPRSLRPCRSKGIRGRARHPCRAG